MYSFQLYRRKGPFSGSNPESIIGLSSNRGCLTGSSLVPTTTREVEEDEPLPEPQPARSDRPRHQPQRLAARYAPPPGRPLPRVEYHLYQPPRGTSGRPFPTSRPRSPPAPRPLLRPCGRPPLGRSPTPWPP